MECLTEVEVQKGTKIEAGEAEGIQQGLLLLPERRHAVGKIAASGQRDIFGNDRQSRRARGDVLHGAQDIQSEPLPEGLDIAGLVEILEAHINHIAGGTLKKEGRHSVSEAILEDSRSDAGEIRGDAALGISKEQVAGEIVHDGQRSAVLAVHAQDANLRIHRTDSGHLLLGRAGIGMTDRPVSAIPHAEVAIHGNAVLARGPDPHARFGKIVHGLAHGIECTAKKFLPFAEDASGRMGVGGIHQYMPDGNIQILLDARAKLWEEIVPNIADASNGHGVHRDDGQARAPIIQYQCLCKKAVAHGEFRGGSRNVGAPGSREERRHLFGDRVFHPEERIKCLLRSASSFIWTILLPRIGSPVGMAYKPREPFTHMSRSNAKQTIFKRRTLVEQIADSLREGIRDGSLSRQLPPERELCRTLRVSRPVLRRAIHRLRDEGLVRVARRRPAEITTRPSRRGRKSMEARAVLGFADTPDCISQWGMMVIDGTRQEFADQGIRFDLVREPSLGRRRVGVRLREFVALHRADYWILAGASAAAQMWFREQRLHAVLMGNAFPEARLPFVNDDLRGVTRHAAGIFLGLGHRHAVFLMRGHGLAGEMQEEAGFREAFAPGAPAEGRVIKHSGRVEGIRDRLEGMFREEPPPTAMLISHAEDTLVAASWFLEHGLRVPQDVSLISFEWAPFLERLRPLPAWYYTDPKDHARRLCRLALRPPGDIRSPRLIIPEFIRNGAVGRPKAPCARPVHKQERGGPSRMGNPARARCPILLI